MTIKPSFVDTLAAYIKCKITNTGPHGKYCGCKKWGIRYGLGCPNPNRKFNINESKQ